MTNTKNTSKNIEDISYTSLNLQQYTNDNQLLFQSSENQYKRIVFLLNIKKNKLRYLVTLTDTTNRTSKIVKKVKCKTIQKALKVFNKIELD